ncbi:uncharacterized protein LOC127733386 [Mytilus californianus]|uniref:uncharacterized protein LOC127733386 n=1 Tax=Mytilus californianus TaxID=6549 RepID=UPI0022461E09|nr:uncharacterized protein LOC127733386 [Mytilus californianus]
MMQVRQWFVALALFISYATPQSTPVFGKLSQTKSNGRFGKNSATTQNSKPATIQSKSRISSLENPEVSVPDTTFSIEKNPKTGKLDLVITERQLLPMDRKFPASPEASQLPPSNHSPLAMEVIRLLDSGIRDNEIDIIDPHTGEVIGKLSHQKTPSGKDQIIQYPERNLPGPSYPMKLPLKERYDARLQNERGQSYPEYKTDNQLHNKDFKINLLSQVQNDFVMNHKNEHVVVDSNNAISVGRQLDMPVILDFSNAFQNDKIIVSPNSRSPVITQIPTDHRISRSRLQSSQVTKKNSQNLEQSVMQLKRIAMLGAKTKHSISPSVSNTANSLSVSPALKAILNWVRENANRFKTMTKKASIMLSKHSKWNNRGKLQSMRRGILSREGSRGHTGENRKAQKQFIMKPYKVQLLSFSKSPSGNVKGRIFEGDRNRLSATRGGRPTELAYHKAPNYHARTGLSRKGGY